MFERMERELCLLEGYSSEKVRDIMNYSDEIFLSEEEETVEEGGKWKIFIADDEPCVHAVTKIALEDFSFEGRTLDFLSAYSGKEALGMLEEHSDKDRIIVKI